MNKEIKEYFESGLTEEAIALKRSGKCIVCETPIEGGELALMIHEVTGLCIEHQKQFRNYLLDKVASENIHPIERVVMECIAFTK